MNRLFQKIFISLFLLSTLITNSVVIADSWRGDVDCDGTITILDALLVAQYYVGLISEFSPCPSPCECPQPPENCADSFELVLSMNENGEVSFGSWEETYCRIVENMDDCLIRFGNRLAKPLYIEYSSNHIRFDFHASHGFHDAWDAYAYIQIEPGVKAGLGMSYRRGHDDLVWMEDIAQHVGGDFSPMDVDILISTHCNGMGSYNHLATFNSQGEVNSGDWISFYDTVVDQMTTCKIRYDNRIFMPSHIEYEDESVSFDMLSLNGRNHSSDSYAYINISKDIRAGIGTNYRSGDGTAVWKKDQEQHSEEEWRSGAVEVYNKEAYSAEYIVTSSGTMIKGTWEDLYADVIYQAYDCKLKYDNRISDPECIEYSSSSLQFEFINLHSYSNDYDAFAYVKIDHNNQAGLSSSYRRGHYNTIWKKSSIQWTGSAAVYPMTITIRVDKSQVNNYTHEMSIQGNGNLSLGNFPDFMNKIMDKNTARLYKLRVDNRITYPLLIEYSPDENLVYFDYHSLSTYHGGNTYEAYALSIVHLNNPCGITGSYRYSPEIKEPGREQYTTYTLTQNDIDIFSR